LLACWQAAGSCCREAQCADQHAASPAELLCTAGQHAGATAQHHSSAAAHTQVCWPLSRSNNQLFSSRAAAKQQQSSGSRLQLHFEF
jgi:hypothetical protein